MEKQTMETIRAVLAPLARQGIIPQSDLREFMARSQTATAPVRRLSVREAARQAGCCEKTIINRIRAGDLPAKKFGPRMWRINPADLA